MRLDRLINGCNGLSAGNEEGAEETGTRITHERTSAKRLCAATGLANTEKILQSCGECGIVKVSNLILTAMVEIVVYNLG